MFAVGDCPPYPPWSAIQKLPAPSWKNPSGSDAEAVQRGGVPKPEPTWVYLTSSFGSDSHAWKLESTTMSLMVLCRTFPETARAAPVLPLS